jgi:hypothetical protein
MARSARATDHSRITRGDGLGSASSVHSIGFREQSIATFPNTRRASGAVARSLALLSSRRMGSAIRRFGAGRPLWVRVVALVPRPCTGR